MPGKRKNFVVRQHRKNLHGRDVLTPPSSSAGNFFGGALPLMGRLDDSFLPRRPNSGKSTLLDAVAQILPRPAHCPPRWNPRLLMPTCFYVASKARRTAGASRQRCLSPRLVGGLNGGSLGWILRRRAHLRRIATQFVFLPGTATAGRPIGDASISRLAPDYVSLSPLKPQFSESTAPTSGIQPKSAWAAASALWRIPHLLSSKFGGARNRAIRLVPQKKKRKGPQAWRKMNYSRGNLGGWETASADRAHKKRHSRE